MATTANHVVETFKLLSASDDDDDTNSGSDDVVSLPPPLPRRKIKTRRKLRPSSSSSSAARSAGGRWAVRVVVSTTVAVALGLLGWLLFTLQLRVDTLERRLADVEVGSKSTPEKLHGIHARLKGLEDMGADLRDNLTRTVTELAAIESQVQKLTATVDQLRESVATAPQIKTLPKDVTILQESVANMGSKINALEMDTKETKALVTSTSQRVDENGQQLQRLAVLRNKTDSSVDAECKDSVDRLNTSLQAEIRLSQDSRTRQQQRLDASANATAQLSARVDQLGNTCRSQDVDCPNSDSTRQRLDNLTLLYHHLLQRVDQDGAQSLAVTLSSTQSRAEVINEQTVPPSVAVSAAFTSPSSASAATTPPSKVDDDDVTTPT